MRRYWPESLAALALTVLFFAVAGIGFHVSAYHWQVVTIPDCPPNAFCHVNTNSLWNVIPMATTVGALFLGIAIPFAIGQRIRRKRE